MGRKRISKPSNDLSGKKFNRLTVKELSHKNKHGQWCWICLCDCGNQKIVSADHLMSGHTKGCGYSCSRTGTKNPRWNGYEEINGTYWCNLKNCAKSRSIPFTITIEEAWKIFLKQNKKCKLSGLDISFCKMTTRSKKSLGTASLDRIDSSKGYTEDNVQWVHKDVNIMKKNHNEDYFLYLCNCVANNMRKKND